jgi:ribose transport system ATP-binding protein
LRVDPRTLVRELELDERQLVEIAESSSSGPHLLILDEPNSALNERETGLSSGSCASCARPA